MILDGCTAGTQRYWTRQEEERAMGGWRRRKSRHRGAEPVDVDPAPGTPEGTASTQEAWANDDFEFVPEFDITSKPFTRNGPRAPAVADDRKSSCGSLPDATAESAKTATHRAPEQSDRFGVQSALVRDTIATYLESVSMGGDPDPPPASASVAVNIETGSDMSNVEASLKEAAAIEGALAVALVDYTSGMSLGTSGDTSVMNLDVAAAGNTDVVRAKLRTIEALGLKDSIEDILITLTNQYHLIRLLRGSSGEGLFLYLVMDKSRANLAMARHRLSVVERNIQV